MRVATSLIDGCRSSSLSHRQPCRHRQNCAKLKFPPVVLQYSFASSWSALYQGALWGVSRMPLSRACGCICTRATNWGSSTWCAANLLTKILDLRGFDSSIILILRGEILRPIGNFLEILSRQILAGRFFVGRLGVDVGDSSAREASAQRKKVLLKVIILGDSGHRVVSHASSGFVHTIIMVIIIIIIYVYALYIYIYIYIYTH